MRSSKRHWPRDEHVVKTFKEGCEVAGTVTHDYKRHGTATLFTALKVFTGDMIRERMPHHRKSEFLKFLKRIDATTPVDPDQHLTVDNYATHKN